MSDRDVTEHGGIRVGQRVRIRAEVFAYWRVHGVSQGWLDRHAVPATVERIVVHDEHGWDSVLLRFFERVEGWFGTDDLEPAPSEQETEAA